LLVWTCVKAGFHSDGTPCNLLEQCPANCLVAEGTVPPPPTPTAAPTAGVILSVGCAEGCGVSLQARQSRRSAAAALPSDVRQACAPTVSDRSSAGCQSKITASQKHRLQTRTQRMKLCSCTSCAGGEPGNTPAPTDASCADFAGFGCATCDGSGCLTCPAGLYAFVHIGTGVFSFCDSCQQINCAPRGCSDNIGAPPHLTSCA
jgi:hypothetical protein